MERLTEKVNGEYIHKVHKCSLNDCYEKLSKLEDIEEELGIPLEVLFKALKDGIYNRNGYIDYVYLDYALLEGKYCLITTDDRVFKLEYYGKTWWLEKPEVNENE